jgi:hypothetical protein
LFWQPGETRAVAVGFSSDVSPAQVAVFQLQEERWLASFAPSDTVQPGANDRSAAEAQRRAVAAGRVEIRPVTRRQIHIDGRPIGGVFD